MAANPNSSAPVVEAGDRVPLVVDLDGTLAVCDVMEESVLAIAGAAPLRMIDLARAFPKGRAAFKQAVADHAAFDAATLPYRPEVLALIEQASAEGRPVVLATAAHEKHAHAVAAHHGVFDEVFATSGTNLKGHAKSRLLVEKFGQGGFDYVGDSAADLPVWSAARQGYGVGGSRMARLRARGANVEWIEGERRGFAARMRTWLRAIRVHQWVKNGLVFLPLLTSHSFNLASAEKAILAFLAFSVAASSVYLVNDMLDLHADRLHPRKRNRPLASGLIAPRAAMPVAALLLLLGIAAGLAVSLPFVGVLLAYVALTSSYSVYLKRKLLVDVIALAFLYSIRVVGGAVAIAVPISEWLVGFCIFTFICLALIKRYTELASHFDRGLTTLSKRNYRVDELALVGSLAIATAMNSVLVFALYVSSDTVRLMYRTPQLLWLICPILVYVLSRMIFLAHRREMHDDPIVFVLKDKVSLAAGVLAILLVIAAI